MKSVTYYLDLHARQFPDNVAFRYVLDGEDKIVTYTYSELRRVALQLATKIRASLQNNRSEKKIALLLYAPGPDFVIAFIACLYAGVIGVPVCPPIPRRLTHDIFRLERLAKDSEADLILADRISDRLLKAALFKQTGQELLKKIITFWKSDWTRSHLKKLPLLVTQDLHNEKHQLHDEGVLSDPIVTADQIAFLQYSSGSTGDPKGVMVSHSSLMINIENIINTVKPNLSSQVISWMPHYHDMGLIGMILAPFVAGVPTTLFSPLAFLENPLRWAKLISRFKGTVTSSPNFGFELLVKRAKEARGLDIDLSSMELALCGAEPINPEVAECFVSEFKKYNFQPGAFFPAFGMAEHTLLVTCGPKGRDPQIKRFHSELLKVGKASEVTTNDISATKFISCGKPLDNHQMLIVDPNTKEVLKEGEVGEIWLKGPSITKGYWNKPDVNQEVFQAKTADGEAPFLRTGDLGFLHKGELYFYGRIKDQLVIHGKKYAPQDLEYSIQNAHEAIRKGNIVVFTINKEGQERVVVVLERKVNPKVANKEIYQEVIKTIARNFELAVYEIVMIKTRSIPKTTSGKLQRNQTKQMYLDDQLCEIDRWSSPLAADNRKSLTGV